MYALAGDFFTNFEEDLDECVVYKLSLQNIDVRTNVVFYRFHTNVRQGARSKNRRAAGTSPRGRLQSGRPRRGLVGRVRWRGRVLKTVLKLVVFAHFRSSARI